MHSPQHMLKFIILFYFHKKIMGKCTHKGNFYSVVCQEISTESYYPHGEQSLTAL